MKTLQDYLENDKELRELLLQRRYKEAMKYLPPSLVPLLVEMLLEIDNNLLDNISSLSSRMFYGSSIKEMIVPSNIETIEESCFEDCVDLSSVIFHSQNKPRILKIEYCAFANCKSLKKVDFSPVYDIAFGSACMFNCNSLNEITLPEHCMISENAFYRCKKLSKVNYLSSIAEFKTNVVLFANSFKGTAVQYVTCLDGIVEVK